MAFIPLAAAAIGSSGLATAATVASVVASGIGAVSAVQTAKFNEEVALNNAEISEENRKSTIFKGTVDAQDQDLAAAGELGALIATAGASGLNLGAGSKLQSRIAKEELAGQDRGRIIQSAGVQAAAFGQQRADFQTSAAQSNTAGKFAILEGAVNIGSSAISGASKINKTKAARLNAGSRI
jgi:hypothetical protein